MRNARQNFDVIRVTIYSSIFHTNNSIPSTCCSHRLRLKDILRALTLIEQVIMINPLFNVRNLALFFPTKKVDRKKRELQIFFTSIILPLCQLYKKIIILIILLTVKQIRKANGSLRLSHPLCRQIESLFSTCHTVQYRLLTVKLNIYI